MRLKVTLSYEGSGYQGFQKQKDGKTIQGELEAVLLQICRQPVSIFASGRTDARAHADNQVFHFDAPIAMKESNWKRAFNSLLPSDIFIKEVEEVHPLFHARYDAKGKEYLYLVNVGEYNPMQTRYILQMGRSLNIEVMKEAAQLFVGKHDFRSFCANKEEDTSSFVRTIHQFTIKEENKIVEFQVTGNGFLRYMVRMMVGTLIEIGLGRKTKDEISKRLDQLKRDTVPFNAPACGLYLKRVEYPEILHNYHTHSARCLHAIGEDEAYVEAAIANGFKTLGFSDHLMSPHIKESWQMRGRPEQLPEYLQSIQSLKEKYESRIDIHVGMECEYFPQLEEELKQLLVTKKCDYLILGLHYLRMDEDNTIHDYSGVIKTKEQLIAYGNLAQKALASNLFTIFAHPDLFMASYPRWDETCETISYQICQAALQYDVILEANLRGISFFGEKSYQDGQRHPYPHKRFFEIAKEVGNRLVIGVDAHDPAELNNETYALGKAFLAELNLAFETKISLKKI